MKVWNEESFNKTLNNGHGTLVGNWFEEEELRRKTGVGRTQMGVHVKKERDLLYSLPTEELQSTIFNPNKQNTKARVLPNERLEHTLTHNSQYGIFDERLLAKAELGPKSKMIQKQFLEQSNSDWNAEEKEKAKIDFNTTYSTMHDKKEIDKYSIGRRNMKDINGNTLTTADRDIDLLVDKNLLQRPQQNTDEELLNFIDPTIHYTKDIPMTYWQERIQHGNFYASKPSSLVDPFKKDNSFLKQFHHYKHSNG